METKQIFHPGDELLMFSKEANASLSVRGKITLTRPFTLEILDPLDELLINKLNTVGEVVVAYARKGYAYKAVISQRTGTTVELSLRDRYEMRDSFRVDTSMMMSYEFIGRAPGFMNRKQDPREEIDFKNLEGATAVEKAMLRLLMKIHQELALLRSSAERAGKSPTNQMVERMASISGSGLRFTVLEEMAKGDTLRLNMSLPRSPRMISCIAHVVRVEADLSGFGSTRAQVAVRFKEISDSDREQIVRFVIQQQQQALIRPFSNNDYAGKA